MATVADSLQPRRHLAEPAGHSPFRLRGLLGPAAVLCGVNCMDNPVEREHEWHRADTVYQRI
jgi:hypothetical protein